MNIKEEKTDDGAAARAAMLKNIKERAAERAEVAREEALKGQCPLIALGKTDDETTSTYYIRERRAIVKIPPWRHNGDMYEDIADLTLWGAWLDPGKSEELLEAERAILWRKVTKKLRSMSRKAGRHNNESERKLGLWREVVDGEEGILCNSGGALHFMPLCGGALREVDGVHGNNYYTRDTVYPPPSAEMATDDEGRIIVEGFHSLTWGFSGAGKLVAGWLVCSLLSDLLEVRPNVWITGAPENGKSRTFELIARLAGWRSKKDTGYCLIREGMDNSSPGMWQELGTSVRPIIYDEVEGNGEANNEANIRKLLAVIRSAATGLNAKITKGGKDGSPIEYLVRSCFLLCSIQSRLEKAADRGRIIELPLVARTESQKKAMAEKQAALEALAGNPDFCGRLLHRVMKLARIFEENVRRLREYIAEKTRNIRRGDIFAPMLAGCHLLTHDGLMSEDDMQRALIVVRCYEQTQDEASDGEQCLSVLLNAVIYTGVYGKMTTRQACEELANAEPDTNKRAALEQALGVYGMRWLKDNQDGWILEVMTVEKHTTNLKKLYDKTRWTDGKIAAVICPGAKQNAEGIKPGTRKGYGRTLRIPARVVSPPEDGTDGDAQA